MFERAILNKYRFETTCGVLTTETLNDLPLTSNHGASFEQVAQDLNRQLKALPEESFVGIKSVNNKELEDKLNIVKRLIEIKLNAIETQKNSKKIATKRASLLARKANLEDSELNEMSMEEVDKALSELS